MPLDSTAVACICSELKNKIVNGKIEKIQQPERDEIVLSIRNTGAHYRLLISADTANPRIHLTEYRKDNPMTAPMFCMLLRKHLTGGKITGVSQPDFERIINIDIESYNELGDVTAKRLSAEFMGRHSNIILIDPEDKIIDSAHRVDMSVKEARGILPGLRYTPPPSQNKINPLAASEDEIRSALSEFSEKSIIRSFYGISPLAAREILAWGEDTPREMVKFFDRVRNEDFSPCLVYDNGGSAFDFSGFYPSQYEGLMKITGKDSLSACMDEFFTKRDMEARMRQKTAALRKTVNNVLDRLNKKIVIHSETLREAGDNDKLKVWGELITANLYRIEDGRDSVTLENYYETDMPQITVPLDRCKSASQNAQSYFKKYRKAKTAEEMAGLQLKKAVSEAEYMESVLISLETAESEGEISEIKSELTLGGYIKKDKKDEKKKTEAAKPMKFLYEGYEIFVGKNNRQNDFLTLKMSRAEDLWLHVKGIPGSHVLVKNCHEEIPLKVAEKAAQLAAYYSKGKDSTNVPVDYTEVKNVKKPSGAKPGMVIYENYRTAYVNPSNTF